MRLFLGLILLQGSAWATCEIDRGSGFRKEDFEIRFPDSVSSLLAGVSPSDQKSVLRACSKQSDYLESMKHLEQAVAQAVVQSPAVLETMKEIDLKLLSWIHRLVELRLKPRFLSKGVLRSTLKTKVQLEIDRILVDYFGHCDGFVPGCIGSKAADIRDSFMNGNLRERFFLSWNTAYELLREQFLCHDKGCACNDEIMKRLQPSSSLDQDILRFCQDWNQGKAPLSRSRFGKTPNEFRRVKKGFDKSVSMFSIQDLVIPLSSRERKFLTQQGLIQSGEGDKPLIWNTGIGNFEPLSRSELRRTSPGFPDPQGYYYSMAELFGFPIVVSISGSTDNLLNLGCILGFSQPSDLKKLRLAALGYMIPQRHHSAIEVLTAGKAYRGLEIFPNSDYYKEIYPEDPLFEEQVVRQYHEISGQKSRLPTEIYRDCIQREIHLPDLLPSPTTLTS